MTDAELERRLGAEPGDVMKALVALAERISPENPRVAFKDLWLELTVFDDDGEGVGTPRNVRRFAETGGDLNHFGLLMDGNLSMDERPIVMVVPKDDDEATQIVAPNLRSFLGLVAVAFGEVISRSADDREWFGVRQAWYGNDKRRLSRMERLSDLLCSIPGVAKPSSPAQVANAHPNQPFRLCFDDEDDSEDDDAALVPGTWDHASAAVDEARRMLLASGYAEAAAHARNGMLHPSFRAGSMYLLAVALSYLDDRAAATAALDAFLAVWFDDTPVPLPDFHVRTKVDRDELVALVERVKPGAEAASLGQRIRATPNPPDDPDFF